MKQLMKNRDLMMLGVLIVMTAAIATRFPGFVTLDNLREIFTDTAILMILALGQMMVILTRCIDLSVAANLALTGMIVGMMNIAFPSIPAAMFLVIAPLTGLVLGALNGFFVWRFAMPSIVVTLGTMSIFRGMIFVLTDGEWINAHEMSGSFLATPRSDFLGLQLLAWIALLLVGAVWLFMGYTRAGRSIYAVGGNPTAAVYTGINVGGSQFLAFCVSGMLSGLAGYLWVARYAVAYVDVARGFELDVVAACVIGGVSIAGGIGTVGGVVLGALFLGIVKNALPVIGVSPFWQMAISGAVIVIAVAINAGRDKSTGKRILRKARRKGASQ